MRPERARRPRRLETLGFNEVYDYAASKVAWFAAGYPAEGSVPDSSRAGAIARTDVPRCALDTTVAELAAIIGDHPRAAVTDADGIVLGLVRREVLDLPDDTRVEAVLQPAPPTVRPSITAHELAESMDKDGRTYVLVSHYDGVLVGLIEREDLHGGH